MERLRRQIEARERDSNDPQGKIPNWTDYDRLPAEEPGGLDRPWLYVVHKAAWDRREIKGAWVPADLDSHSVAMVVSSAAGETLARADLAVVDQMGVDTMVDEDHFTQQPVHPEVRQ